MKKILTLLLLVFITAWSSYGFVQTSYWFSQSSGTEYAFDLSKGTALGEGLTLDEQTFSNILMPDGFKFKFDGVDYTTFAVSVNGAMQFLALGDAPDASGLAVLSTAKNAVAAFNADLLAADATSKISYWVSGAAGDRTLTVQWYRFKVLGTVSLVAAPVNFQVVLHEKGNVIEIIYGSTQADFASLGVQVGLVGAATTDFLVRADGAAGSEWRASVAGASNAAVLTYNTTVFPKAAASNQSLHYYWTPNAPGAAKTPVFPADAATCVANPVTATWTQTAQSITAGLADSQKIYFGTDPAALTVAATLAGNVTSFALPTLMPATKYYWKVVPSNVFGDATATVFSFTTQNLLPALATVVYPLVGDTNVANIPAVVLKWNAPAVSTTNGAPELYKIYFNDTYGPLNLVKTQAETSFTITNLDTNKVYNWRVDVVNSGCGGGTTTGTVWSFRTRNYSPAAPTLTAPVCGSYMVAQKPLFTWTAPVVNLPVFTAGVKYHFWLASDAGFTTILKDTVTTALSYNANHVGFPALALNTKYYWKVQAIDVLNHAGTVTAVCDFTVTPGKGDLSGIVFGNIYWPLAQTLYVNGAVVTAKPVISAYPTATATSQPDGSYSFTGLYAVAYTLTATHPDFRPSIAKSVTVPAAGAIVQNIHMPRPTIWTTPYINVTLRPGACVSYTNSAFFIQVTNYGDGVMTWNHTIDTPAPWLSLKKIAGPYTLGVDEDSFTGGKVVLDSTTFNLSGLAVGQYTTTVTYTTATPNVGKVTVPVKLDVVGAPVVAATNLVTTIDQSNGFVTISFDGPKSTDPDAVNMVITKNGTVFATLPLNATGKYSINDVITALPNTNVTNDYKVEAIYNLGYTTCPATSSVTLYGPAYTANAGVSMTLLPGATGHIMYNVANSGQTNSLLYNNIVPASFVTAVAPANFTIPAGTSKDFDLTFSAVGKTVGTYTVVLTNNTNLGPKFINATLYVANAHTLAGTVTHGVGADPLLGATVVATNVITGVSYTTTTNDYGKYSIANVLGGDYSIVFSMLGYQSVTVAKSIALNAASSTVVTDANLWENTYGPAAACVTAAVNAEDTQADVAWCAPSGAYEMLYDDNSAENFAVWDYAGNMNAVKFSPRGPKAVVDGARFFVGNGAFPVGGNFIGQSVDVAVYAADGTNGLPGTQIAKKNVVVNGFGWITVTGINASVPSGDFYIALIQKSDAPNAVPIGVDETLPTAYMSYSRNLSSASPWILSPFQDFMIHAILSSEITTGDKMAASTFVQPGTTIETIGTEQVIRKVAATGFTSATAAKAQPGMTGMEAVVVVPEEYNATDAVKMYKLTRYPFDVKTATRGTGVVISSTLTTNTYTDGGAAWSGLAAGWYQYGVKALYTSNPAAQESAEVFTNAVPHKLATTITVNVKDGCGAVVPGATVTLTPNDAVNYPATYYKTLKGTTGEDGQIVFNNANAATGVYTLQAPYALKVNKNNYDAYNLPVSVLVASKTINVVLDDHRYVPYNLTIDPITLVAKWDTVGDVYKQDFEGAFSWGTSGSTWTRYSWAFGYFNYPNTWEVTSDLSSANFAIPAHTKYAAVNADKAGAVDPTMVLYDGMRTPYWAFDQAPKNEIAFDYFFTGAENTTAELWYRVLGAESVAYWYSFATLPAGTGWQTYKFSVDEMGYGNVPNLSGNEGGKAQFAFVAIGDGSENTGTGLAIDNIRIIGTVNPPLGFAFFLDKTGEVSQVAKNTTTFTINPNQAPYGQTFLAGVAGYYCSGYSYDTLNMARTRFTSHFLYAPKNVTATPNVAITAGGADVAWEAPVTASAPGQPGEVTLQYCSESITSGFSGDGDAGTAWRAMIRLNSTKLADFYNSKELTKIMMGFANYNFTKVTAKVYKQTAGTSGTALAESKLIYSEDVTSKVVKGQWNTVTLAQSIPLLSGFDYYVGYEVLAPSGQYVSGMMDATTPYSLNNWVWDNLHGWNSLHDIAAVAGYTMDNYNWALKAVINNGVPGNLVSYNVYRDGVKVGNVLKPTTTFADWGVTPGNHCYTVTALYDPASFGLTGALLESQPADPEACIDINFGFQMPFTEDWTHGQDLNLWTGISNDQTGKNWIIDGQEGNPRPAAKFRWDPAQTNYAMAIESFFIDASVINTTTPYQILFDFDLKIDNRTSTGKETLLAEVWDGVKWTAVKTFAATADQDWTAVSIDITDLVKEKVFKIRFNAKGVKSADLGFWSIDNVNIHQMLNMKAVSDLAVTTINKPANDNKLTWTAPGAGVTSYNVYRRAFQVAYGDPIVGSGDWTLLEGDITATEYFDMNLSNLETNCYEYKVTAVYPEGESDASNIVAACITVGVAPANTNEVKLYPNPATDYVKIDLSKPVVSINVYNSLGAVVAQKNVQGENTITLNTRNFAAGAYSVRFTTESGQTFSRKFVVTK